MWFEWSFRTIYTLLLLFCHTVSANTEIINFVPSAEHTVDLPTPAVGNWPKLTFANNEQRWLLQPAALHTPLHQVCEMKDENASGNTLSCPHELWVTLDLDDQNWASYATFTLRLSWAASTPADFLIEIYSPETVLTRLSRWQQISLEPEKVNARSSQSSKERSTTTTRVKYARIRVVDAGVLTPYVPLAHHHHHHHNDAPAILAVDCAPIPFILVLEQLYWGVLPASLLPTVYFLIPVLLAAALAVPWVVAYLDTFVQQAREDLNRKASLGKKGG
ncbi:hypothetical protein F5I97DRAFT_1247507 [Phlebopus sp. FC_14]|nr:hypothetical protein F5I97DRAFT_1247507 [Phlebopus sp. FC_14]